MENLVAEVRKLTSSLAKLESELAVSKNITTVLSGRLVLMERRCWANAQYSERMCGSCRDAFIILSKPAGGLSL